MPTAALATLLAGCASGPSPMQVKVNNLDARVSKLERFVSNGSLVQLAQQQGSLRAQIRKLRGQVDDLQRSNRQLKKQQHDLYADLDKRMTALEHAEAGAAAPAAGAGAPGAGTGTGPAGAGTGAGAGAGTGAGTGAGAGAAASANAGNASQPVTLPGVTPTQQSVYGQAFDALKAGSYSVAIKGFGGFVKSYPKSPLAPNAEYWLGEAHFVNRNYKAAERAFRTVLRRWPDSGKASDAMLDLGNALMAQGRMREGRDTLRRLVKRYPGTSAAKRAAGMVGKGAAR